jgi:hypothetical protein
MPSSGGFERVPVLYEDELGWGARVSQFGPHVLVCACIADRRRVAGAVGTSAWNIQQLTDPRPQKGNASLLAAADRLAPVHRTLVIVIDTDRTPVALGLPRNAPPDQVKHAIEARFAGKSSSMPIVCPLVRNMETVVEAAAEVLGESPPVRKKPLDRDRRLLRLASKEDPAARERLLELVPSFGRLVAQLDEVLKAAAVEWGLLTSSGRA